MTIFGTYSQYYNLLYQEKDYAGEVEFVHGLIQKYCQGSRNILDLGCGTGKHDILLAGKGYSITGVDMSVEMLTIAKSNIPKSDYQSSNISFFHGDIRSFRLEKTFDVVLSLFHVMSYQTSNDDLDAAFATAKVHLRPGGVFIFDCWYGPAVLSERPEVRVKRLSDDEIEVLRICEPVMHPNENCVDVNYEVLITQKTTGKTEKNNESHRMRYLFMPEIDELISSNGMDKLFACEWLTGRAPGIDTWGVCIGLKNK